MQMIPRLTGNLFRAGRALAGLTRDDLANRASLCRHSIRKWETSSHAIPGRCIRTCAERLMCLRVKVRGSAAMGSAHYPATHQII